MTFLRVARPGCAAGATRGRARRRLLLGHVLLGTGGCLAVLAGCGLENDLPPNSLEITATTVSSRVLLPDGGTEERSRLIDGDPSDPEWNAVPYFFVAMSPENGNQGGSFLASLKVARDTTRLYVLVQWPDETADRLGPRLVWDPSRDLSATGCDSLLVSCSWRLTDDDEDRLAVMWDLGGAGDGGRTFRDHGCQVACHGNMHPLTGAVDIWQWRAARTNPIQFPPIEGRRVGFADDGYASSGGRVNDPGASFFRENYRMVNCGGGRQAPVPLELPDVLNTDSRPDFKENDFMLPCEYIADFRGFAFDFCSRNNPCRVFEQEDLVEWNEGDELSATLINTRFARASRHDVEARGTWRPETSEGTPKGVWTLEMSRSLRNNRSEDIDFDFSRNEPYTMAIAIMNNSGRVHSGSPPIHVFLN